MSVSVVEYQIRFLRHPGRQCGDRHGHRKANRQRDRPAPGQPTAPAYQPDGDRCQRAEFRPDNHRAHHRHGGIGDDAHPGQQGGDGQEGQKRAGQRGVVTGPGFHLVPDDRIGRVPGCPLLRLPGVAGQRQVHLLDGDRTAVVEVEGSKAGEQVVADLPGRVELDQVAGR